MVLLSTKNLKVASNRYSTPKLSSKFIGPFKIIEVGANTNAYKLELPEQLRIHPTINIERLRLFQESRFPNQPRNLNRPQPEMNESTGINEYEVEAVIGKSGEGAATKYLIKWKGYPMYESSWKLASELSSAQDAVSAFEEISMERD